MMQMSRSGLVKVRELVGWGLDGNEYRPQLDAQTIATERACSNISSRTSFTVIDPIVTTPTELRTDVLAQQFDRCDLQAEMQGLDWSIGIVDLRHLIAFQRRLVFDPEYLHPAAPASDAWPQLTALAFGAPAPITYTTLPSSSAELLLQSTNPNLQFRQATVGSCSPVQIYGGSPFFEVAEYRGRWFLRDGYHRAHSLLNANVFHLPAVIIRARTLVELGPVKPRFFPEHILFGPHPPLVTDFLRDDLTIEYTRPRLLKTLRVSIEESFAPASPNPNTGEFE